MLGDKKCQKGQQRTFFKNLLFERVPHMKTICNDDEIYIAFVIYEGVFSLKVILAKSTKARE